jgi:hypothetical protein
LYVGQRRGLKLIDRPGHDLRLVGPTQPINGLSPEGRVHARLVCRLDEMIVDRECAFRFNGTPEYEAALAQAAVSIRAAVEAHRSESGTRLPQPPALGQELDALRVAPDGALEVIEVKPGTATGPIGWAPAQVAVYVELFERWFRDDAAIAHDTIRRMIDQRVALGLGSPRRLSDPVHIRAVVAIGKPLHNPNVALNRLRDVQKRLLSEGVTSRVADVRLVARDGSFEPVD